VSRCSNANLDCDATIRSLDRFGIGNAGRRGGRELESAMWILLLLPFIGLLWVPFYNFAEPSLFGFPFFYWYQLAWVPISSLLIWLVYRRQTPDETP
jgi:Protein of unknown function (DUF3311)